MPAPPRVSPFAARVYAACREIPRGKVASYSSLARHIGSRSPRAVGRALRGNPFAPEVPCHRVIQSDGRLGGFRGGHAEGAAKRRLLAREGVRFTADGRLAEEDRWHRF